jgi:hypothetical protein
MGNAVSISQERELFHALKHEIDTEHSKHHDHDGNLSNVDEDHGDEFNENDNEEEEEEEEKQTNLIEIHSQENITPLYENVLRVIKKWENKVELESTATFCDFLDIEDTVEAAFAAGLTPLILDQSSDEKLCTFYSYQPDAVILECKSLILELARSPLISCLEIARKRLVNAMKFGKLLVLRMGKSAPDFRNTFNDERLQSVVTRSDGNGILGSVEAYFPREVFLSGGRLLFENNWADRLFREEDMKPHKNFAL